MRQRGMFRVAVVMLVVVAAFVGVAAAQQIVPVPAAGRVFTLADFKPVETGPSPNGTWTQQVYCNAQKAVAVSLFNDIQKCGNGVGCTIIYPGGGAACSQGLAYQWACGVAVRNDKPHAEILPWFNMLTQLDHQCVQSNSPTGICSAVGDCWQGEKYAVCNAQTNRCELVVGQ